MTDEAGGGRDADPGELVRRRVVVDGRVQGVFFRDTCRRRATERGLAGWVTNRPDGRLEAVFEGPAADVDALVAWAHEGPPHAQVAGVDVRTEEPEGLSGFQVR